jgi:hypothetical protein
MAMVDRVRAQQLQQMMAPVLNRWQLLRPYCAPTHIRHRARHGTRAPGVLRPLPLSLPVEWL